MDISEISAQVTSIGIEPGYIINLLIGIAGVFIMMQLRDIKTDIKDLKLMTHQHALDIKELKTILEVKKDAI